MISPKSYLLPHADIQWLNDSSPYSTHYDDIYWSRNGGIAEKQHVFLDACQLARRWRSLAANDQFTVLEAGFGFGLNFYLCVQHWLSLKRQGQISKSARLNVISYEQYLVSATNMKRMATHLGFENEWAMLEPSYPMPVPGCHSIDVSEGVQLQLIVGDIHDHIEDLHGKLDAVFFDGFSPGKNEAIWHDSIIRRICSHLRLGAIVSSYSVAGKLKRALKQSGLIVQKTPGFGQKREMLVGRQPGDWKPHTTTDKDVLIIGAGLSGLLLSDALRRRGVDVRVVDATGQGLGALGSIQQVALYPLLSRTPQPYSNFYLRAFLFLKNRLDYSNCGRMELLDDDLQLDHAEQLAEQLPGLIKILDPQSASDLSGIPITQPALWFPSAGWIQPADMTRQTHIDDARVEGLNFDSGRWRVHCTNHRSLEASHVVFATGAVSHELLEPFKLVPLRGQSIRIEGQSQNPRVVLSMNKTWFPLLDTTATLSATYQRFDSDLASRTEDSEQLLSSVRPFLGDQKLEYTESTGIRAASRDRMPIVDAVPDWPELNQYCKAKPNTPFQGFQPNLFATIGYGSHGATLGHYCAELLARQICDEASCEDLRLLSSTRFAFRDAGVKPRQLNAR